MNRLNIFGALASLPGPSTKEDIIIQLAKQQNIRFNDLPQLQKDVDHALKESQRLGFVDREGPIYKLNMEVRTVAYGNQHKSIQKKAASDKAKANKLLGQGDFERSRSLIRSYSGTRMRNSSGSVHSSTEKNAEPQEQKAMDTCNCCDPNGDNEKDIENASWKCSNAWL